MGNTFARCIHNLLRQNLLLRTLRKILDFFSLSFSHFESIYVYVCVCAMCFCFTISWSLHCYHFCICIWMYVCRFFVESFARTMESEKVSCVHTNTIESFCVSVCVCFCVHLLLLDKSEMKANEEEEDEKKYQIIMVSIKSWAPNFTNRCLPKVKWGII